MPSVHERGFNPSAKLRLRVDENKESHHSRTGFVGDRIALLTRISLIGIPPRRNVRRSDQDWAFCQLTDIPERAVQRAKGRKAKERVLLGTKSTPKTRLSQSAILPISGLRFPAGGRPLADCFS